MKSIVSFFLSLLYEKVSSQKDWEQIKLKLANLYGATSPDTHRELTGEKKAKSLVNHS